MSIQIVICRCIVVKSEDRKEEMNTAIIILH
jgi:hypothetical protein